MNIRGIIKQLFCKHSIDHQIYLYDSKITCWKCDKSLKRWNFNEEPSSKEEGVCYCDTSDGPCNICEAKWEAQQN